ncbi:MAG: fumarylacetoacetate hydrolase family protein [Actinobacteria bacterium]|nr:fumarylacetoacetate hydrolase family protein [Actinomycetota bacterium]
MRFAHLADSDAPLAAIDGAAIAPLAAAAGFATLDDLIAAGPESWSAAAEAARAALAADPQPLADARLAAPLRAPSKIVAIGLNYMDHIRETGLAEPQSPLVFAKFLNSLAGPGDEIWWPDGLTEKVDWEVELAAVIGRRMRDVAPADALDGIFGYTVGNDISARDLQFGDEQWVRGKSLDSFCPLGPAVVTAEEFGDPQDKALSLRVNGQDKQVSNTGEMIFGTAEIVSFLSHNFTLEPGDVILTGTPWGCGGFSEPPEFLAAGDVVEAEVEGIGVLRNPVSGPR